VPQQCHRSLARYRSQALVWIPFLGDSTKSTAEQSISTRCVAMQISLDPARADHEAEFLRMTVPQNEGYNPQELRVFHRMGKAYGILFFSWTMY
jgi:hypothetical protein